MAEARLRDVRPAAETSKRLNSWKEIAAYFSRDVRTVRRWESELGLPVHRRQHTRRGIVYAYHAELDAWWTDGRKRLEKVPERPAEGTRLLLAAMAIAGVLLLAGGYYAWQYFRVNSRLSSLEITRTTRLTSHGRAIKTAISPDGRYIAQTYDTAGRQSLLVRRATTLHDVEIVPPESRYFLGVTFAPDNESIFYVTAPLGGGPSFLYRIPVMGGPAQKLKQDLDSPVTFSPDGKRYAFVREAAGEGSLIVADLNSGAEQTVLSHKLPNGLDYPAWSPDGQSIACTAVDSSIASTGGSDARIIEVLVADRTERPFANRTWPFIRQLAWVNGGQGLAISARDQDTGAYHVWYVPRSNGSARKITDGLTSQTGVSVSADSSRLLTVEERTVSGIWLMRSATTQDALPISLESENCNSALWTADGRIIYDQQLNGQRNIWSMAADGTDRKQLTTAGNNYDPSISSDGRRLAYVSSRSGSPAIWTMDADGGNPAMVGKTDGQPYPQLSPDGKWIAFTATGKGHWPTLRRVDVKGGPATELNDKLWLQPAISPDGKWIAGFYVEQPSGTRNNPDNIAVIGSAGGQLRKVIPISPSVVTSAGIRWSPDGRQLTYVEHRKEGANIWRLPLDGGGPHQVTQLRGYNLFSFGWSPDGKQLAVSRGIEARDLVLIEATTSNR